jgi:hypothetical protein
VDRNLERRIDDVAGRMTSPEAPAGLRSRVSVRLGEQSPAHPRRAWIAIAAGALLAVLGAGWWSVSVPNPWPVRSNQPDPALIAEAISPAPVRTSTPVARGTALPRSLERTPMDIPRQEPASHSMLIPPLAPMAPIEIVRIQPDAVAIPLLVMQPVETTPVSIAPISALESIAGG